MSHPPTMILEAGNSEAGTLHNYSLHGSWLPIRAATGYTSCWEVGISTSTALPRTRSLTAYACHWWTSLVITSFSLNFLLEPRLLHHWRLWRRHYGRRSLLLWDQTPIWPHWPRLFFSLPILAQDLEDLVVLLLHHARRNTESCRRIKLGEGCLDLRRHGLRGRNSSPVGW